ncbi:MAG: hypothetical protein HY738_17320 [Bacteroidia bacterium]|nr:hypothetical protein [Bacteroidia bacterium]
MTYRQTYEIQNEKHLLIRLPKFFKNRKKVVIIIEDEKEEHTKKIKLLKQAIKDPIFLADIEEINDDFKNIDRETL